MSIHEEDTNMFSTEEFIFIKGTLPRTFIFCQQLKDILFHFTNEETEDNIKYLAQSHTDITANHLN